MNYKKIALVELNQFSSENEDYSLGEIFYSFLRLDSEKFLKTVKQIKHLSDERIYELIREAREEEKAE